MLLENLEMVDVRMEEEGQKAVLVFIDEERGEIREVNFNKQSYDNGKFINDPKKSDWVDEKVLEIFDLEYDKLSQAIGTRHNIYAYPRFNSMYEVSIVEKFDKGMVGQIFETEVTEVEVDDIGIKIKFKHEDTTYESKMNYADYMEDLGKWFVNPQKKLKQEAKFEEKFHIKVSDSEELVGVKVMIEVKLAFGKFVYNEIKPLPKKK